MPTHPHRAASDAASYDRLASLTRADIAWEWLRRDPDYRQLAAGSARRTERGVLVERAPSWCEARWGCLNVADVGCDIGQPILWSAAVMPGALSAEALPARLGSRIAFDLRRWAPYAMLIGDRPEFEHLLLHGDGRCLRLDIIHGSLCAGPVNLRYVFDGDGDHKREIGTLRRFLLLCRTGKFAALEPDAPAPRRSIDALRVHDALGEGASIRDIGTLLFGAARIQSEWQAPGEALKSQCRRLIAHARFMAAGGFRTLLR